MITSPLEVSSNGLATNICNYAVLAFERRLFYKTPPSVHSILNILNSVPGFFLIYCFVPLRPVVMDAGPAVEKTCERREDPWPPRRQVRCSPAAVDARLPPERIGKKMDSPVASEKAVALDAGAPPAGVG